MFGAGCSRQPLLPVGPLFFSPRGFPFNSTSKERVAFVARPVGFDVFLVCFGALGRLLLALLAPMAVDYGTQEGGSLPKPCPLL